MTYDRTTHTDISLKDPPPKEPLTAFELANMVASRELTTLHNVCREMTRRLLNPASSEGDKDPKTGTTR